MPQLLIATNNEGKVAELRGLLAGCGWEIVAPRDIGLALDVEETGATYSENARLKAAAFSRAAGLPALAEDSGLEVDALGGEPGPLHHRRGWDGRTAYETSQRLLDALEGVPAERRTARYRTVIVVALADGAVIEAEGACEGVIADAPRRQRGLRLRPHLLPALAGQDDGRAEYRGQEPHQPSGLGRGEPEGAAAQGSRAAVWLIAPSTASVRYPDQAMERQTVLDTRQRPLRDLRISVTDRCNFRCTYCMPKEVFGRDYVFLDREQLLTFEEIARLTRVFVGLGVEKVRLTGGEPLLRRDIEKLVAMLAAIDGLDDLALTTNGSLLSEKAQALKDAGLSRVSVSLDSLNDATFMALNDVDFPVSPVLEAIDTAARVGLTPVKVDMVVKRGVNDGDLLDMAGSFRHTGHILRFIEYMDVGTTNGWRLDDVVPAAAIVDRINAVWPIEPSTPTTTARWPSAIVTGTAPVRSASSPR